MKTIHKITLVLIALLLLAGLLVSIGGPRQAAAAPSQSGAVQMVDEIVLPEAYPIILDGEWGPGQDCVAWNS